MLYKVDMDGVPKMDCLEEELQGDNRTKNQVKSQLNKLLTLDKMNSVKNLTMMTVYQH